MLRVTVSAALSFIFFVVLHFLHFHFFIPHDKTISVLLAALVGLFVFVLLVRTLPGEEWFAAKFRISDAVMKRWVFPALGALFYGFLILGYFEFYFTADRSITFRMLMIADEQQDHSITSEQMLAKYDLPVIILRRLDDLTYGGYLERQENRFRLTTKGRTVLAIYRFTIEFLHLGRY